MVQEILKNIEQRAEEEILRIDKEKEQAVLVLEKKYQELAKKQKEKILENFKQKIESEIQEFSQKKELELEFAVLREKNKIIEGLYEEVGKKLTENNLKELISFLLPKNIEGKIRAGKKTAEILKQKINKEIKDDLEEEGFLIIGEDLDLDFKISEVLKQEKEKQKPKIIKLLFN